MNELNSTRKQIEVLNLVVYSASLRKVEEVYESAESHLSITYSGKVLRNVVTRMLERITSDDFSGAFGYIIEKMNEGASYIHFAKYLCSRFPDETLLHVSWMINATDTMRRDVATAIIEILKSLAGHFEESILEQLREYSTNYDYSPDIVFTSIELYLSYLHHSVKMGYQFDEADELVFNKYKSYLQGRPLNKAKELCCKMDEIESREYSNCICVDNDYLNSIFE